MYIAVLAVRMKVASYCLVISGPRSQFFLKIVKAVVDRDASHNKKPVQLDENTENIRSTL